MALCSGLPSQIAIGWVLSVAGWAPVDANGQFALGFIATLTLLDTAVLIGLMVIFLRSRGERPGDLWLGQRPVAGELARGLVHLPVVFLIVTGLLTALRYTVPQLHNVPTSPFGAIAGRDALNAAALVLVAIVAGGVREELQRAFLLVRFERNLGPAWLGVVVLSIAFGLGHIVQGRDAVVATGAVGAFWAVVYLRRRSSVAPMLSHALFNALEVVGLASMSLGH